MRTKKRPAGGAGGGNEHPCSTTRRRRNLRREAFSTFCTRSRRLYTPMRAVRPIDRRTVYDSRDGPPNHLSSAGQCLARTPNGPYSTGCVRAAFGCLCRLDRMLILPTSQPFPADLGQLARGRDPSDLRACALANPDIEVLQSRILANRFHRCFIQNPA